MTIFRDLLRTSEGAAGLVVLAMLVLVAVFGPLLSPGDPLNIAGSPLLPPFSNANLPLGTDSLGRDVLAGIIHGARSSLMIGLAAALAAMTLGVSVGLAAGFAGGVVDEILMRLVDAFQIVPGFLLALAFVSIVGPSLPVVVVAITLAAWASPARLMRAQVLAVREAEHVAAARVIGMHPFEIAVRQILPTAVPPVLALSAVVVAAAILTESALSFLGLSDPNLVTWGSMIAEGRNVLRSAPWLSVFPGLALLVTVVTIYLVSEGLAKAIAAGKARL